MNKSTVLPGPMAEPDETMTSRVGFEPVDAVHRETLNAAVEGLKAVLPREGSRDQKTDF